MKPTDTRDPSDQPAVGDTQVIDLHDVELLVAAQALAQEQEHARSRPPPLPPELRASHVPEQPPLSRQPLSMSQPPAPPPRSSVFYVVAILVFLGLGVGGGVFFAMRRAAVPAAAAPSAAAASAASRPPQAAVITIPTIELGDDTDSGK